VTTESCCQDFGISSINLNTYFMKKTYVLMAGVMLCLNALSQQCGLSFFTFDNLSKNGSNNVTVRFITNTENSDLDRFEIYRSRDGASTFQIAGVIPGTKSGNVTYNYTDLGAQNPIAPADRLYYRIIWYNTVGEACTSITRTVLPPIAYSNPCTPTALIVPDNKVCSGSSAAFEITNSPNIVSWSLSPNNPAVATLTPFSGTRVIVNQIGAGFITLNASVSGNGCTKNFSQQLIIGNAPVENNGISTYTINGSLRSLGSGNGNSVSAGSTSSINISLNNLITLGNVTWSVFQSGSPAISGFGQTGNGHQAWFNINLPTGQMSNSASLNYTAAHGCGTTNGNVGFTVFKSFFFTVMQAEGSDQVTIQSHSNNTRNTAVETMSTAKIYGVRVIDQSGIVRKNYSFKGGIFNTTLYLKGLRSGIYVVSVFDGSRWSNRKIFLK
jgi:hypothetical protein